MVESGLNEDKIVLGRVYPAQGQEAAITKELVEDAIAAGQVYTLSTIKDAWIAYRKKQVLRVLDKGKWHIRPLSAVSTIVMGTKAEVVKLSSVMSFPKYLERHSKR